MFTERAAKLESADRRIHFLQRLFALQAHIAVVFPLHQVLQDPHHGIVAAQLSRSTTCMRTASLSSEAAPGRASCAPAGSLRQRLQAFQRLQPHARVGIVRHRVEQRRRALPRRRPGSSAGPPIPRARRDFLFGAAASSSFWMFWSSMFRRPRAGGFRRTRSARGRRYPAARSAR